MKFTESYTFNFDAIVTIACQYEFCVCKTFVYTISLVFQINDNCAIIKH